jgi:hypothetical protein
MQNDFANLDAQSPISTFAQFTTEEHEEYQRYLDAQQARHDADNFDDSADDGPHSDAHMYPADAPADEGHMYPDDGDYDPSGDGDF